MPALFRSHRAALLALLAAVLVVLAVAALRLSDDASARPAEGGTITLAVPGPAARINPLDAASTSAEHYLAELVYSGLTRPGPDGAPQPAIAERWDVSDDARTFTFRLRRELTWHDGRPVTADDVVFTVEALVDMGPRADPRLLEVWSRATVSRMSVDQVRVELPEPFAPLPAYAAFGLLPRHLLGSVQPTQLLEHAFFRAPVGAGPFRFVSLTEERAVLSRFDAYVLGPAWADAVEVRLTPDASTAISAVARGDAQGAPAVPAQEMPGLHRLQSARPAYTAVIVNHADSLFADAGVRRALSLALDRAALARAQGGVPADIPFIPGWWANDGSSVTPPQPDEAARLLDEAGWTRGEDGLRRRNGRELTFALIAVAEGGQAELAGQVAAAWSAIGARAVVTAVPAGELLGRFLQPRMFQTALLTWDPGPDPDPFSAWHSSLAGSPTGNFGDVRDAGIDRLAEIGRAAPRLSERRAAAVAFAAHFRETAPGIILFGEPLSFTARDPLTLPARPAAAEAPDRLADVHRWSVRTRR